MSLYREELEQPFLEDAARFYSTKAIALLSRVTISEYLREAELLCAQEQKRCESRLHRT
ncbi:Cullin repeat-like-containing domain [Phytophthora cactorum]|nr:Cullin repeat-like-containing domain [Phytophthora cactorum]